MTFNLRYIFVALIFALCQTALADNSYSVENKVLHISGTGDVEALPKKYKSSKKIVLEDGLTVITQSAFKGCKKLSAVVLPLTLKEVGAEAFAECPGIKAVVLSSRVATIGEHAFDCPDLTAVVCSALIPPVVKSADAFACDKSVCTLFVPQQCIEAYKSAPGWSEFTDIKPLSEYKSE